MATPPDDSRPAPSAPPPLTVAASLVAVEGIVFLILAVAEVAALDAEKAVMAGTTSLFFLVYGGGLLVCAWGVWRLRSWARAPIVVAQVLQLAVAWSFWGEPTTWVAVGLAIVALIVLAGTFHPQSLDALGERS